jgi:Ulp1 family protease
MLLLVLLGEDLPLLIADACKEPLTPAEDRIVDRALGSSRQARIVDAFNLEVMGEHAKTLNPGQWLCDEVVNFYMTLLDKRDVS